jgi:hypothetical protein
MQSHFAKRNEHTEMNQHDCEVLADNLLHAVFYGEGDAFFTQVIMHPLRFIRSVSTTTEKTRRPVHKKCSLTQSLTRLLLQIFFGKSDVSATSQVAEEEHVKHAVVNVVKKYKVLRDSQERFPWLVDFICTILQNDLTVARSTPGDATRTVRENRAEQRPTTATLRTTPH